MSTDAEWAAMGRELARTLIRFAHDRDDRDKKAIAEQHTAICAEYRHELYEQADKANDEAQPE
jgi:hypothetical protein